MGADVMRWQYCAQPPERNLLFGFGPAETIKREFLTFWNSVKFFVDYANIVGLPAVLVGAEPRRRRSTRSTAGSSSARTRSCATPRRRTRDTSPSTSCALTPSTSTISRTGTSAARGAASGTATTTRPSRRCGTRSSQTLRVMAPILPFVTDHLWRTLVLDGPESVHLAGWPEVPEPDRGASRRDRGGAARRRARPAGALTQRASSFGSRCAGSVDKGAEPRASAAWDVIADEVRVKDVELGR